MPRLDRSRAVVIALEEITDGATFLRVRHDADGREARAIAWTDLTGPVRVGDRVLCNITAVSLGLGTGGYDVVIASEADRPAPEPNGREHIVKVRYTSSQHAVVPAEMDPRMRDTVDLTGLPVVVCGLHSQIAPVVAGARAARPGVRVGVIQTDTGALPVAFSHLLRALKQLRWIESIVSCGQAFGGDLECVGLASALQAARVLLEVELVVVSQGPGNAGTGTPYGFSGIEQGAWCDIAGALGARVVAVPRCSDADPRARHRGVSHHTVTALGTFAQRRATIAFPSNREDLLATARSGRLGERHTILEVDVSSGMELLRVSGLRVTSMGRGIDDDPVVFAAAVAAGMAAMQPENPNDIGQSP